MTDETKHALETAFNDYHAATDADWRAFMADKSPEPQREERRIARIWATRTAFLAKINDIAVQL